MTGFEFLDKHRYIRNTLFLIIILLVGTIIYSLLNGSNISTPYLNITRPKDTIASLPKKNIDTTSSKSLKTVTGKSKNQYKVNEKKDSINNLKPSTAYSVTSNNQMGGITAGQVYINENNQRKLTIQSKEFLLSKFPDKNKSIDVNYIMGDKEGYNFAAEILSFLKSNNFPKAKINSAMFMSEPSYGVEIEEKDTVTNINVFNDPATKPK
ncbi:hypothetical protein FMM05_05925 [Flavobacterium zepuense]|uniref:Uncharacterized protein n=1 Tax=Flavobacterium zepuense TaxID=2593302 RepID=A0A552V5M7_9FLAO|nr:hypothetical protein [Flavobacterium zepuense]TRW25758.1 hypothetical protein FMM05_05925 [Flavobacterium zepuense]